MNKQKNKQVLEQDITEIVAPKPKRNIFLRFLWGSIKFILKLIVFVIASIILIGIAAVLLLRNSTVQTMIADFVNEQLVESVENLDVDDFAIMEDLIESAALAQSDAGDIAEEDSASSNAASDRDAQYYDSPWSGVWECSDGSVFVILCDEDANIVMYDANIDASFTIYAGATTVSDTLIECTMIDYSCDYYAEYTFTRSGDTLRYTETFGREDEMIYDNLLFTKNDRSDLIAAYQEYFDK